MEPFGLSLATVAFFIGFGLLIGILFGFFGMGGSFLVTPALLVLGYPANVAVGSGLAFVFGTSFIGALEHRDHGQIDYRLAGLMIVGMTVGIEVGKRAVFFLEAIGSADLVLSTTYVVLLASVGLFTLRDARTETSGSAGIALARRVQSISLPPTVTLAGGATVSVWVVLVVGAVIGVLSGFLGVGGGFLLMPAMVYVFGVPAAVAVGTDILQITVSGAYGAFAYAQAGSVELPVVASLLLGSALGARIGAGATKLVDENAITGYFAAMLLAGSLSVGANELGARFGIEALGTASIALVFGATVLVSGAVVLAAVCALRGERGGSWCRFVSA